MKKLVRCTSDVTIAKNHGAKEVDQFHFTPDSMLGSPESIKSASLNSGITASTATDWVQPNIAQGKLEKDVLWLSFQKFIINLCFL